MIKVLIVVLSELSSGELTIGYEFGRRLTEKTFAVTYIVPDKFTAYLQSRNQIFKALDVNAGPVANKKIIHTYISEVEPDYIMVSDVYTTEYSRVWSGINLAFLKEYKIPIIGLDEYEYLSTNCTPDYYGGIFEQLPPLLEHCDYIVRDCPINMKRNPAIKNVQYFGLYEDDFELSERERAKIREELGIDENRKVIFFASSAWESINFHKTPSLGMLIKWMPFIIQNYLKDLDEPITLLHIGPNPWKNVAADKIDYKNYTGLKPEDFDKYLLASDLFITTNVVSVTLSKAIFGKVPCIVFQNDKLIDFNHLRKALTTKPFWYQEMAKELRCVYPFRAGFFGWYRLLEPVLRENPYTETYQVAQLFKYREVIESIKTYLFDQSKIVELKNRQAGYVKEVLKLNTPDEIMQIFIEGEKGEKL